MTRMKTTIELDEKKLARLMQATGIKTRREAVDYAITQAERLSRLNRLVRKSLYVRETGDVVAPDYDLQALRELDRPRR